MATTTQDVSSNFETNLRDRLIAAQTGQGAAHAHDGTPHSNGSDPYTPESRPQSGQDGHIDPLIDGATDSSVQQQNSPDFDMTGITMDVAGSPMSNNQKAANRRELSTTKRAAQNRAAQRAFRQRKEAYITKLEKQVQDYRAMEEDFKSLQHENFELRDYVIVLQKCILDSSSELPPAPSRVHLGASGDHSRSTHPDDHARLGTGLNNSSQQAPTASMVNNSRPSEDGFAQTAVDQLQAAAAEAGELGNSTKTES